MCSRPPSSPTMVGSAVETIVWSSEARSITSSRAPMTSPSRRPPVCSTPSTPAEASGWRCPPGTARACAARHATVDIPGREGEAPLMLEAQLKEVPFFKTLGKKELRAVAQQTDELDVKAG